MMTIRQIERHWTAKAYAKLSRQLLAARPEASFRLEIELGHPIPAAAMALIRMDELNQSYTPLYSTLLRELLASQSTDGSWSDPMTTSLCLRALMCNQGNGQAIDRALSYLANMQKTEGIWPKVPFRRMPADPFVSAFILFQLGSVPLFRSAIRFFDALNWFDAHEKDLDPETRHLWDHASHRCQLQSPQLPFPIKKGTLLQGARLISKSIRDY